MTPSERMQALWAESVELARFFGRERESVLATYRKYSDEHVQIDRADVVHLAESHAWMLNRLAGQVLFQAEMTSESITDLANELSRINQAANRGRPIRRLAQTLRKLVRSRLF